MIRVAGYCRVSTDKEDQVNSFQAQQRYFREYIERHPDWQLSAIYADEGVTGTSTKKRDQFNRMIADARAGQFQLILVKEISRFSRNILDTISYTRELKTIGVSVLFMTENLSTLDPAAEMLLTFMGTIAQEESRRTSVRVKWGQTRQMEQGVVFGNSLLGYNVKGGHLTVIPQEADLVRKIFHMYGVEKKSATTIARELEEAGYCTHTGTARWTGSRIIRILKNEKYVGDLVQKKTFTPDYLTHQKKINHGEEPMIALCDHHTPLVSRELWDTVQAELSQRNRHNGQIAGHSCRYAFSGKIRCGECGAPFIARSKYLKDGTSVLRWSCRTVATQGAATCAVGKLIRDDDARQMLCQALSQLSFDRDAVVGYITRIAAKAIKADREAGREHLQRQLQRTEHKIAALLDAYFSDDICKEEMQLLKNRYDRQIAQIHEQLEASSSPTDDPNDSDSLRLLLAAALEDSLENGALCRQLVQLLTVYQDRHMELRVHHLPHVFHFSESVNTFGTNQGGLC